MNYSIGAYFRAPRNQSFFPFGSEKAGRHYTYLAEAGHRQGVAFFAVHLGCYRGNQTFRDAYRFTGKEWEHVPGETRVDIVFLKTPHLIDTLDTADLTMCHRDLELLNDDKALMQRHFGDLLPQAVSVTRQEWQEALHHVPGDVLVLKPVDGSRGNGVWIGKREEFNASCFDETYTHYILQEFIDSSAGIPGLFSGRHDLRLILAQEVPILSFVRIAQEGTYLANFAQGGRLEVLDVAALPPEVQAFARQVDSRLSHLSPRFYTIDMIRRTDGRYFLTEINTGPGLPNPEVEGREFMDTFYNHFFRLCEETVTRQN